jgi:hypothetical protein
MKLPLRPLSVLLLLVAPVGLSAAAVKPDIVPPMRRDAAVNVANKLTKRPAPTPVSPELPNPFNPANFNDPDPNAPRLPGGARPGAAGAGAAGPVSPPADREILDTLAARLTPSGTLSLGGKPLLIIDRNRFEVGTKFIVTFNEQDFELELVAIDRTTFTLRYRGEEVTRPIKPVK